MNTPTVSYYDSNGTNFFDIEKEFFVIDSDNLDKISTRFYGFSVQETGIYEEESITEDALAQLDGCGCYISITRNGNLNSMGGGKITIQQDFNGCYGIYLYQNDDYFALSNSFFRLLDHLKHRVSLTLNRDYANYFLSRDLCSESYSETMVNEINVVDKDVIIVINPETADLYFKHIYYGEKTVYVNSPEGIRILDNWYQKWIAIFRNIKERTKQISADLSGGFDSRMTLLLMLKSGINLNEIWVNSANDKLHVHEEDFKIASEIANHFGFALNQTNLRLTALNYSLNDILNLSFYTKLTFHKEMYFKHKKFVYKRYRISGSGGECVRGYWNMPAKEFILDAEKRAYRYSLSVSKEMSVSLKKIFNSALYELGKKHNVTDINDPTLLSLLYREGRNRNHFGKAVVEDFFSGTYNLTPLIDPTLRQLKLDDSQCLDKDLLMALIFVRYCPELLQFRIQGKRSINEETINYAHHINQKFPFDQNGSSSLIFNPNFTVNTIDKKAQALLNEGKNNQHLHKSRPDEYLISLFNSVSFRKLFATCFDEEIYLHAKNWKDSATYFPLRECYGVIGVTKVIEDVITSTQTKKPSLTQSLDNFICNNSYTPSGSLDDLPQFIKNYFTARIDIKIPGDSANFSLVKTSDSHAIITNPGRFNKNGKGYVIESCQGHLDLEFKIENGEQLQITLRGKAFRREDGSREEYWIEYQSMVINGRSVFTDKKVARNDRSIWFVHSVKKGEIVRLSLMWTPYEYSKTILNKIRSRSSKLISKLFRHRYN